MTDDLLRLATAPADSDAPAPSAALIFAHADDETIGLGARLGRYRFARIVTVTDSAPANGEDCRAHGFVSLGDYRLARSRELQTVLRTAGFEGIQECLGIPDQEASLTLELLTRRIFDVLNSVRPEVVFTHPYEGGHPDHDACAFAVHRAVRLMRFDGGQAPEIIECAFYHAGARGVESGTFLETPDRTPVLEYKLSPAELARKTALIRLFATQAETLGGFALTSERFRVAPVYDFSMPPHPGRLLYETFPWGMTAERFCQLAREADRALFPAVRGASPCA